MDSFLICGVLKISMKVYFLSVQLFFSSFAFSSIKSACETEGQKMIKLVMCLRVQILLLDFVIEYIYGIQKKQQQQNQKPCAVKMHLQCKVFHFLFSVVHLCTFHDILMSIIRLPIGQEPSRRFWKPPGTRNKYVASFSFRATNEFQHFVTRNCKM